MKRIAVIPRTGPIVGYLETRAVEISDSKNPEDWDGLVLLTGEIPAPWLESLYKNGRPIAALVPNAIDRLAEILGHQGVTLAGPATRESKHVYWEACAAHDFITDREHRLITPGGQTLSALHGALNELIQLA